MTTPGIYQKLNFDRCDHKLLGTCAEDTDGCCAVVACDLCLRIFDAYITPDQYDVAEPIASGRAAFSGNGYAGQVESITFSAEWVRDYQTDVCKVIVEIVDPFDTQLLEFTKCYDPEADCMFPSGEQEVTYLLEGVPKAVKLVWTPLDIMTLRHRREPYNECQLPACGECTCSTRDLCLILTGSDGCSESLLVKGPKPPDAPCLLEELPEWDYAFLCGYTPVTGSLRLEHNDVTGQCELIHEVPENYVEQVIALDGDACRTIDETFSWSVGDGDNEISYTLAVRSADCDECEPVWGVCYCGPDNIVETIKVSIFSGLTGLTPLGTITMRRALIPVPGCPNSTLVFPVPCQGFYGQATMMFPIGMGEFEENSIELRLYCATDCSSCFEHRFGSELGGVNRGWRGWVRDSLQSEFLQCSPRFSAIVLWGSACQGYEDNYIWQQPPTPADANCYSNSEYQITEFLLEQLTP